MPNECTTETIFTTFWCNKKDTTNKRLTRITGPISSHSFSFSFSSICHSSPNSNQNRICSLKMSFCFTAQSLSTPLKCEISRNPFQRMENDDKEIEIIWNYRFQSANSSVCAYAWMCIGADIGKCSSRWFSSSALRWLLKALETRQLSCKCRRIY